MRYFITHIAPKAVIMKYHIPVAPCNFCFNLIEGNMFDKVYNILPANIIGNPTDFTDNIVETVYSSWRGKRILHKFAPFIEDLKLFPKITNGSSVWFYNVNMLTALLIVLLQIFKPSVKRYTIVLDYTPGAKWNSFLIKLINSSNGIISLSTSDLFTVNNFCILPGVVPIGNSQPNQEKPIIKEFLMSGNLNEQISMLHLVLPAFARMTDFKLHITGFSGDDEYIKSFSDNYPNIIYHGMMEYVDFLDLMHKCPFILSTRNPEFPENSCNFPSKIIEGLLHNRIIISTIHYVQLNGVNYWEVPTNIDGFISSILELTSMDDDNLLNFANQSKIVQDKFNNKVWKEWINRIEHNAK